MRALSPLNLGFAEEQIDKFGLQNFPNAASLPSASDFGVGVAYVEDSSKILSSDGAEWSHKLKQVATRCAQSTNYSASHKQASSRTRHYATDTINSIKLGWFNGHCDYLTSPYEIPNPGTAQYWAQIEDKDSNIIAVMTFDNGAASKRAQSGTVTFTDMVKLSSPIKAGELFFVYQFVQYSVGINWTTGVAGLNVVQNGPDPSGEAFTFGASGVTNRVLAGLSGVYNNNTVQRGALRPQTIIALTDKRSIALIHDSRDASTHYNALDGYGDYGQIAPSLGRQTAVMQLGYLGAKASVEKTALSARLQLAEYCTDVVITLGVNDMAASSDAATLLADVTAIKDLIGLPTYLATVPPKTDAGNTTTDATVNPKRLTHNASVRAIPEGFLGFVEIADLVESSRDSGLWKTGYSTDGLHENETGARGIRSSGLIKFPF